MEEETTYFDIFLKYGLFLAGIFQLLCILALIFIPATYLRKLEKEREENIAANNNENKSSIGKQKKQTDKLRKRR